MKRIALIHITETAIGPMSGAIRRYPDLHPVHYLDGRIREKIAEEGITDETMGRMIDMIARACADGAEGIILTCTMFSPYVPDFRKLFSVPIIGADVAMMEQAASRKGRKALLCTFENTRETSTNLLRACCEKAGNPSEITTIVLTDAFLEAAKGNIAGHNQIIAEKIRDLENDYDQIILAQMSMADAVPEKISGRASIYTSPAAACETIR